MNQNLTEENKNKVEKSIEENIIEENKFLEKSTEENKNFEKSEEKNSIEEINIENPKGKLYDIILYRKILPKKTLEICKSFENENILIQVFQEEALLDMKEIKKSQILEKIIEMEPSNTNESVAIGFAYYCLQKYNQSIQIFFKFDNIPFVQYILGIQYQQGFYYCLF
jgi:hypothetical protein